MTKQPAFGLSLALAVSVTLSGCATSSTGSDDAADVDSAAGISTIDEGIAWAQDLDDETSAEELSAGIAKIGDLVIALDIPAEERNEIGSALLTLDSQVDSDPENVDDHIEELDEIVEDIEAAIEKGS